jgi:hypothetical protein
MRLIDADKLKEHKFLTPDAEEAKKWLPAETQGYQLGWNDCIDAIVDNAPTVERPHGEWIYIGQRNRLKVVECTNCHKRQYGSMKYCGNCGADMRGGKQ